ncbi:MAG: DUF1292 domain-containing protein [bacterium]|nr:DUF1292 domain-containing protein [bacterium]MDD6224808.1 DUF1292 domain-containing protein [bacterium]MDY3861331.1 DUF1292 domain-containing protein [Ruminococcus sp.]
MLNNEDFPEENVEEEANIIVLTDDEGNDVEFEYLDTVEFEGSEYIVLIENTEDADEAVILKIESLDDENETYVGVEDEDVLNSVFKIFKDRYKDDFDFAE